VLRGAGLALRRLYSRGFVLAASWGVITVLHLWPYGFGINAAPFASRLIGRPGLQGKPDGGRHVAPR